MEPFSTDRSAVRHQRQRLLHGEERALDVDAERLVEVLFGDRSQRSKFAATGICEDDVEVPLLLLHRRVQPVKIREVGHIALHPGDMVADQFHGGIKLGLTPASDEDIRAFCDESLCGS